MTFKGEQHQLYRSYSVRMQYTVAFCKHCDHEIYFNNEQWYHTHSNNTLCWRGLGVQRTVAEPKDENAGTS